MCFLAQRKEGEDTDSFLTAFENACEMHRVDPADRLQFLTPLLDPKAMEVYSQMTGAEAGDYELFKQALLPEFGLTPEMYRRRFRSQRKTPEVTYLQLVNRMQGYARKWTAGCPSDLRLWLVDGRKVNGYWDTGAEVTLARPEVVAPDRVVPNTYLTLMGVGFDGGRPRGLANKPQTALVVTRSQSRRGALRPDLGEGTIPEVQDPTLVGRECRGARLREAVASDPAIEERSLLAEAQGPGRPQCGLDHEERLPGEVPVGEGVLANPDFDKPFMVFTDASDTGLGAVLMQEDGKGERHPIVYLSKKFLPREPHYAAIEKECLAMVWALKKLEPYLFGRHFTVYTDHSPLTWLHQMKGANVKLRRWSLLLQDYDMDVVHVKGRANMIADALSRRGGPELPQ
ncbi:unnamed protein product, partial [Lepidochelys kempii]